MKKPLKPDIKQKVLEEIHKAIDRIEGRYGVRIRYNIDSVQTLTKIKK